MLALTPKTFTAEAPDTIATHRFGQYFLGNRKSEAGFSYIILAVQNGEVLILRTFCSIKNVLKTGSVKQPAGAFKTEIRRGRRGIPRSDSR